MVPGEISNKYSDKLILSWCVAATFSQITLRKICQNTGFSVTCISPYSGILNATLGFELIIAIFLTFILYKEICFSKAYLQY